jgi:integrase
LKKLKTWIEFEQKKKDMFVYQFSKFMASEFMIFINNEPNISARTYNNYLRFYKTLFNWIVQYNYMKDNPFEGLKKKTTRTTKNRIPIPQDLRIQLKEYLEVENPNFLAIMLIEYYCLLRPNEILYLKISDIDLERRIIRVDEENAKNDNTSYRTIPDILNPFLENLLLSGDKDNYVFSDDKHYNFAPGKHHMNPRKISKYWSKLRDKFGFAMNYKFYSLKDTGIIDLLEAGVSPEDVRDQADHYDLSVTSVYARHIKPTGSEAIRKLAKEF